MNQVNVETFALSIQFIKICFYIRYPWSGLGCC